MKLDARDERTRARTYIDAYTEIADDKTSRRSGCFEVEPSTCPPRFSFSSQKFSASLLRFLFSIDDRAATLLRNRSRYRKFAQTFAINVR
jgi:hypothetical protein